MTRYHEIEKLCLCLLFTYTKLRHILLSAEIIIICKSDVIKHMLTAPVLKGRLGSTPDNKVGSTGRGRCSSSSLISTDVWVGGSAGILSLLSTVVAPMISLQGVLGSLGSLNTLIPSSSSLEIVRVLNHLMLQGRKSLSHWLRPWLRLRLNRMEHRSS
jgi:hypothetical protein